MDIQLAAGLSVTSFYRCIQRGIKAILICNALAYAFPRQHEDIERAANEFKSISYNGAIPGCVACVDGFLVQIKTPSSNETGNVKA